MKEIPAESDAVAVNLEVRGNTLAFSIGRPEAPFALGLVR